MDRVRKPNISESYTLSSESHSKKTSIFWAVTLYSLLKANRRFGGTCLHLRSRRISLLLTSCFTLVSCLAYSSTLEIEGTCSYETSVAFQRTARRYVPENRTLHDHLCESFKCCTTRADHSRCWKSFLPLRTLSSQFRAIFIFERWCSFLEIQPT
jgi:hypothetical protein